MKWVDHMLRKIWRTLTEEGLDSDCFAYVIVILLRENTPHGLCTVNLKIAKPFGETKAELSRWDKFAYRFIWNIDSVDKVTKPL